MKTILTLSVLSLFSISAHAERVFAIDYAEIMFGCKQDGRNVSADTTQMAYVNIRLNPTGGEMRLPLDLITSNGESVSFQGQVIGKLANAAICVIDDGNSWARPSWNAVQFTNGAKLTLKANSHPETCAQDIENDQWVRTNIYTMSVEVNGATLVQSFDQQDSYASPSSCEVL